MDSPLKITQVPSLDTQKNKKTEPYQNTPFNQINSNNVKSSQISFQSDDTLPKNQDSDSKLEIKVQLSDFDSEKSQHEEPQSLILPIQSSKNNLSQPEITQNSKILRICQEGLCSKQNSICQSQNHNSILNSETLNPKCSKCQSTLLCPKTSENSLKWIQCIQCLDMVHELCEIQPSSSELRRAVCFNCSTKKRALIVREPMKTRRSQKLSSLKKSQIKRFKFFKQRLQNYAYLDCFLNGFSYKLALSEEQVKKEIKTLQIKENNTRSKKTYKY